MRSSNFNPIPNLSVMQKNTHLFDIYGIIKETLKEKMSGVVDIHDKVGHDLFLSTREWAKFKKVVLKIEFLSFTPKPSSMKIISKNERKSVKK